MSKVYDCVMFFNELDMLELRFNILDDVVDYFVVCEAEETHSGQRKPLNLLDHYDRFAKWRHKMVYVNAGLLSNGKRTSWDRERYHRSQIAEGLFSAAPDDWVIVADCDEIPNPELVGGLSAIPRECSAVKFELDFYYYDFNHRVQQGWAIGAMRWGVEQNPNKIRTCGTSDPLELRDAGWHFSYFGGPQAIIEKHAAFMHHGDPGIAELPHDPRYIEQKVQASLDLYGRDLRVVPVPTDTSSLPQYVTEHSEHYREMGWLE